MAKSTPKIKKRYLTHLGNTYEVTFCNSLPESCECIDSPSGLTPTFDSFGFSEKQLSQQLSFGLWTEINL